MAFVGIVAAAFNLAQLSCAHINTVWAVCATALDVLVIYALVVYGGQARNRT